MNRRNLLILLAVLAALLLPVAGPYAMAIGIAVCLHVMLASSVRLCLVAKLFNVSMSAFMAIGAYTSALVVKQAGLPFEIGVLSGVVAAGLVSIIVGYPALRLTTGLYFGMVAIAFVEVVRMLAIVMQPITGGPYGLMRIPRPTLLGFSLDNDAAVYYLALGFLILALVVLYRLDRSRFGLTWRAIGQSENLARAVGINLGLYKTLAFLITSVFAALAGAFTAHYITFISPGSFAVMVSLYPLLYTWVGGQSRFIGPVVGAVFMTLLSEPFRGQGQYQMILHSAVLLAVVIFFPGGLITLPHRLASVFHLSPRARTGASSQVSEEASLVKAE